MLLLDRVTDLDPSGGPWGRGYLRAELDIAPDDWFFDGHFKNDPCMPGTLMFEGCLQAMAFYLAALGFTLRARRLALPAGRRAAVPAAVPRPGHPDLAAARLRGLRRGGRRRARADALRRPARARSTASRRSTRGASALELVPDWPLDGDAARCSPRRAADAASPARRGRRLPLRPRRACSPAPGAAVRGLRADVRALRRPDARRRGCPGPPYHFMQPHRPRSTAPIGVMQAGARRSIVEYDVPDRRLVLRRERLPDACRSRCCSRPRCSRAAGSSSYVGSALSVDEELGFRNLDGTGTLLGEVCPRRRHAHAPRVKLTSVSRDRRHDHRGVRGRAAPLGETAGLRR